MAATLGGPGLYLLGNALFRRVVYGGVPPSHIAGLLGLAVWAAAAAALGLSLLALCAGVVALLLIVAAWDGCTQRQ